jgi:excisionase family DNA binding protein
MSRVKEAERAYTLDEAAALLSLSKDTLRRAIKATEGNVLPAKLIGGKYRIRASALDAWFDRLADA